MSGKQEIIEKLGMAPHKEGGYFVRTYESDKKAAIGPGNANRPVMTSIYYLLTDDSPVGCLHRNRSDIVHYFHHGNAIDYILLHPDGKLEKKVLGNDIQKGETLQLVVKGGCWKACRLSGGEYGLLSEAVAPGFEYDDHTMADSSLIKSRFPDHFDLLAEYINQVDSR